MRRYFSTFPAGCYEIISRNIKSFQLNDLKIVEHDDSSVIFESLLPIERLTELRYFTNVYIVLEGSAPTIKPVLRGKYFRLMLLKNGTANQLEVSERTKLESKIKQEFGLEPNTHLSKNDFYVIERLSGNRLFTLRLPKAGFKKEKLSKGELRPELAYILCLSAGMKAKYTLVDLFAGYGSIPAEAIRGFGCKNVIAIDSQLLPKRHEYSAITWHKADARDLNFITNNSVDRVITDPPWGNYDSQIDNLQSLYVDFTKEMTRILKPNGIAVVLSGYDKAQECLEKTGNLLLIKKWNILVSGKKAMIFKLQKP